MCFPKEKADRVELQAKYDEEDGSVNDTEVTSSVQCEIPNDMPEHIDTQNSSDTILGHIYENKDETITVWSSEDAFVLDSQEPCLNSEID